MCNCIGSSDVVTRVRWNQVNLTATAKMEVPREPRLAVRSKVAEKSGKSHDPNEVRVILRLHGMSQSYVAIVHATHYQNGRN